MNQIKGFGAFIILSFLLTPYGWSGKEGAEMEDFPYIIINNPAQPAELKEVLRKKAQEIQFPLSDEDKKSIQTLENKFDNEKNCAGLAAPQIGISKRIIVFAAPENPALKKWRPDFTQTMSKTIWINPSYTPVGSETHADYEACFTVESLAGTVERYKRIKYQAYIVTGEQVEGEAEGFLARMIQHEIDHLNGILFIDLALEGTLLSMEEYRAKRAAAMEQINP